MSIPIGQASTQGGSWFGSLQTRDELFLVAVSDILISSAALRKESSEKTCRCPL